MILKVNNSLSRAYYISYDALERILLTFIFNLYNKTHKEHIMQDSIIVYRNPLEKMIWEGGYLFPIIVFAVVMLVSFIGVYKFLQYIFKREHVSFIWVSGIVSFTCGWFAAQSVFKYFQMN